MASIERLSLPSSPLGAMNDGLSGRVGHGPAPRPFSEVLKQALQQVNRLQVEAQAQAEALARGEVQDLHTVALAIERAQLAMELTVAVRNKLVEAYQEISRMQV